MRLEVETSDGWIDLVQYLSNDNISGSYNDVYGSNNDVSINGTPILDIVNNDYSFNFVSRYIPTNTCVQIMEYFMPKTIRINTDFFGTYSTFTAYRDSIQMVKITDSYSKLSIALKMFKG